MTKILAILRAIIADARSWLGYFGKRPPEKEWLWADHWGWTGPGMAAHWARYFRNPGDKEARKNLITEWARLSPERAGKVASLLIVTAFLGWPVCLLVGLLIG